MLILQCIYLESVGTIVFIIEESYFQLTSKQSLTTLPCRECCEACPQSAVSELCFGSK